MELDERFMAGLIIFIFCLLIFGMGAVYGMPNELENGCIVHNDKVYCEEVNIGE